MNTNTVDYRKGEKVIRRINLRDITVSHNPRNPIPNLYNALKEQEINVSPIELIHEYAFTDKAQQFVSWVEMYESGPKGLVELATSRQEKELEPIILRSFRVRIPGSEEYVEKYGIVAGERRTLAAAYLFAKGLGDGTIGAQVQKLTVDEAFDLAVAENYHRSDPSELETGDIIRHYRERVNPETGKRFTLREVANFLKMDYQYARGREALTYLDDSDKRRLQTGRLGLTVAINKGLTIKSGKEAAEVADKKNHRQRVMTLAEIQTAFDNNRKAPGAWLEALAYVMHLSLDDAEAQSDQRIAAKQERDAKKEIREANHADQKFLNNKEE